MTSMLAKLFLRPNIVSRQEWRAKPPSEKLMPLQPGVTKLVVTFTNSPQCYSKDECVKRVQSIQTKHMEVKKKADIQHNFLIGGDGNVYEGRGWKNAPTYNTKKEDLNNLNGVSIEIAFIGENGMKPTVKMIKAFAGLLFRGMDEKALTNELRKLKPCFLAGDTLVEVEGGKYPKEVEKMSEKELLEEYKSMGLTQ